MDKCVHCGFCLPACPTYVLWGEEMDSPRGRIWLMRKAALGEAPLDNIFQTHIDNCLGCMACMTACPSGVEYNKLIEDTRGQVERQAERSGSRSLSDRLFRKLLFATFPHPKRLRILGIPLALYQRTGLQTLIRADRPAQTLSRAPAIDGSPAPTRSHSTHSTRFPTPRVKPTDRAAASACSPAACRTPTSRTSTPPPRACSLPKALRSLSRKSQSCCGALMVHSGLETHPPGPTRRR